MNNQQYLRLNFVSLNIISIILLINFWIHCTFLSVDHKDLPKVIIGSKAGTNLLLLVLKHKLWKIVNQKRKVKSNYVKVMMVACYNPGIWLSYLILFSRSRFLFVKLQYLQEYLFCFEGMFQILKETWEWRRGSRKF